MVKEDNRGESIEGTMRVQMLKQLSIANVYTIETNYSVNNGPRLFKQVDYKFLEQIAASIADAIQGLIEDKPITSLRNFCLVTNL